MQLAVLAFLMVAAPQPLPDHLDIPDGHSTVICPSVEAAQTMLDQFHGVQPAPRNHTIDTDLFFEGLRQTGCSQDGTDRRGDVLIRSVVSRKSLTMADGEERYLIYQGVNQSDNKPLIGIVSEDSNNGFARTDVARWMMGRTADGWLDARNNADGAWIFYRCDTVEQAAAVVTSLKGLEKTAPKAFTAKMKKQLEGQKCRPASDRYYVTAVRDEAGNDCGFECYVSLTAIEAVDRSGKKVGLVFDASLI